MFDWMPMWVVRRVLRKKGWSCAGCGRQHAMNGVGEITRGMVLTCQGCGRKVSLREVATRGGEGSGMDDGPPVGRAGDPPPGSVIEKVDDGYSTVSYQIPASGSRVACCFLRFFGMRFWRCFTCSFFLTAWMRCPGLCGCFWGFFQLVGVWLLVTALKNKYTVNRIVLDRENVTLRREFWKFGKTKIFARKSVESVEVAAFYQVNYENVYGVEVKGGKKKWRFGVGLDPDEKGWLAADLRVALGLEEVRDEEEMEELDLRKPVEGWSWEKVGKLESAFWIVGAIFFVIGVAMFFFQTAPKFPVGVDGVVAWMRCSVPFLCWFPGCLAWCPLSLVPCCWWRGGK